MSKEAPEEFLCPITMLVMREPVVTPMGYSYEKEAISKWLTTHPNCPITSEPLTSQQLCPNRALQSLIDVFLQENPEYLLDDTMVYLPDSWKKSVLDALHLQNVNVLKEWFTRDRRLKTAKLLENKTVLHIACEEIPGDFMEKLMDLLPCNHDLSFWQDLDRSVLSQALKAATIAYDLQKVKCLIKSGANIDAIGNCGKTALHWACCCGYMDIATILLEKGANWQEFDKQGWTAFHLAAYQGHCDIMQLLINRSADINCLNASDNPSNEHSMTPLLLAAQNGKDAAIVWLIKNGAMIDHHSNKGWTALLLACQKGHLETVKLLLQHNAAINAVNKYGESALHIAALSGNLPIVEVLLAAGADPNTIDKFGKTSAQLAIEHSHENVQQLFMLVQDNSKTSCKY